MSASQQSTTELDKHFCEIVRWHFSEETGTPFWRDWQKTAGWNPAEDVTSFADLVRFPHFDGELLRSEPHDRWVPRAYSGRPYTIFETGGTTGMPKQRIGWDDYKTDYEQFSASLNEVAFPRGGHWLMVGPTGPRRLRLAIEHLANFRGSSCYFVDLDPRWVKKLIKSKQFNQAKAYMAHVVDQAVAILENRNVSALFTTPKLLEELGDRMSIVEAGIKGVFCAGRPWIRKQQGSFAKRFSKAKWSSSRPTATPSWDLPLTNAA
jgi:phenylacetate-coenzyme A ligase PaaK-like adenylate-forming protein